jgi:hypothetical protein
MTVTTKTIVIPSNPSDLKAIKDACREISDCFVRMDAEKDQVKEIVDMLAEKYELPKKMISKMAKAFHKSTFDKEVTEQEDFQVLYETVMR